MRSEGISAYRDTKPDTEALIREHTDLVRRIALHLTARLPSSVQSDDLIQAGMLGLLEAAQRYEPDKGASFATYAGIRIRGAMVDEVRRGDWAPRSVHKNARRISNAIAEIEARGGKTADDAQVAGSLGVDLQEYHRMLNDSASARLFSFDSLLEDESWHAVSSYGETQRVAEALELREKVATAIAELPEREQLILSLYYEECLNLKEIGAVLTVSESRVSQIMTQATLRLRAKLQDRTTESLPGDTG